MRVSFFVRINSYDIAFVTDFNYDIRADGSALSAARAIGIVCLSWVKAVFIGVPGDYNATLWAYRYTKPTALTHLSINCYFASHF